MEIHERNVKILWVWARVYLMGNEYEIYIFFLIFSSMGPKLEISNLLVASDKEIPYLPSYLF